MQSRVLSTVWNPSPNLAGDVRGSSVDATHLSNGQHPRVQSMFDAAGVVKIVINIAIDIHGNSC